ncbi:MAG: hypothetical protein H0Z32_09520 [Bacillaceae bacterium]|nr:hypothetical protein [Bacillaceae bacterium]
MYILRRAFWFFIGVAEYLLSWVVNIFLVADELRLIMQEFLLEVVEISILVVGLYPSVVG